MKPFHKLNDLSPEAFQRETGLSKEEDRLLLTLYYLRHYPTFANLGDIFGISESYCCKIYNDFMGY